MISFLIVSIIPLSSYGINDREVSFGEWWRSGAGLFASILGIVFPIAGYLLLIRHKHSRIVYISSIAFIYIFYHVIFGLDRKVIIPELIVLILLVGLASSYLYLSKSVNAYFRFEHTSNTQFMSSRRRLFWVLIIAFCMISILIYIMIMPNK